jgi:uncharacterized protein
MKFPKNIIIHIMMVTFLLTLFSLTADAAIEIKGFVNDYAEVIPLEYETKISAVLQRLYNSKEAEFAVVTIDSLEGQDIESYSLNLAQGKLGDKEKNNGLLLLIAIEDRDYRFEVGRGIEPIFNDAKIGRIGRDYLVENFRKGDYGEGIYQASLAINNELLGENNTLVPVTNTSTRVQSRGLSGIFSFFIFFMVISSIIGSIGGSKHHRKNRYFNAALMAGLLMGGRGRGGMGGLGGGGLGGFGGGGFGGGGASGGW